MIGIKAIAVELPDRGVETVTLAPAVGVELEALHDYIGFRVLARASEEQEVSDLCAVAASTLFQEQKMNPEDIDCVAVVTQNPDGYGIPHVAAILQSKLGLAQRCACFDIGLGSSGYVHGLTILKGFMESNGFKNGLLFTCSLYSRLVGEMDGHASLLFGDAATVTLLSDQPIWTIGKSLFGTAGSQGRAFQVRVRLGGRLVLDPEVVAEFARRFGAESIREVLKINDLSLGVVDRVVVQQAWKELIKNIGEALQIPEKIGFYAEGYGDTASSSIPIVLSQHLAQSDRCVALFGFGSGLSYATTVLQREARTEVAIASGASRGFDLD